MRRLKSFFCSAVQKENYRLKQLRQETDDASTISNKPHQATSSSCNIDNDKRKVIEKKNVNVMNIYGGMKKDRPIGISTIIRRHNEFEDHIPSRIQNSQKPSEVQCSDKKSCSKKENKITESLFTALDDDGQKLPKYGISNSPSQPNTPKTTLHQNLMVRKRKMDEHKGIAKKIKVISNTFALNKEQIEIENKVTVKSDKDTKESAGLQNSRDDKKIQKSAKTSVSKRSFTTIEYRNTVKEKLSKELYGKFKKASQSYTKSNDLDQLLLDLQDIFVVGSGLEDLFINFSMFVKRNQRREFEETVHQILQS